MRRRYDIVNETRWRTADLRTFVIAAAKVEFVDDEKPRLRVTFKVSRRVSVRGRASIGGAWSTIWILNPERWWAVLPSEDPKRQLASVLCHEFAHNGGMSHERRMRASTRYGWQPGWEQHFTWADALELRPQPAKAARLTGERLVEARRQRTAEAIGRWETKAKRAANALKKLRARLRYYDRRAAAMHAKPQPHEES